MGGGFGFVVFVAGFRAAAVAGGHGDEALDEGFFRGTGFGGGRGIEAQRGGRHAEDVLARGDADVGGGGHAGTQAEVVVADIEIGFVGHDVLRDGGAIGHDGNNGAVSAIRPGIDGEGGLLAFLDATDVGLGDGDFQNHALQLLGDDEQLRRGETGGDGLTGLDASLEHDAVDGRFDDGAAEIVLVDAHLGLGSADSGLCVEQIGLRTLGGGDGGVDDGFGGHFAAADALKLLLACEQRGAFLHRGLGERDTSLRGSHGGAIALGLLQKLAGVELGKLLAFGDAVIDVSIHFERDAGKLAADGDFVRRLQITRGGDAEENIATRERLRDIERHLLLGLFDAAAPIPSAQAERDDDEAEDGVALEVSLGSAGLDGFSEIGRG